MLESKKKVLGFGGNCLEVPLSIGDWNEMVGKLYAKWKAWKERYCVERWPVERLDSSILSAQN